MKKLLLIFLVLLVGCISTPIDYDLNNDTPEQHEVGNIKINIHNSTQFFYELEIFYQTSDKTIKNIMLMPDEDLNIWLPAGIYKVCFWKTLEFDIEIKCVDKGVGNEIDNNWIIKKRE